MNEASRHEWVVPHSPPDLETPRLHTIDADPERSGLAAVYLRVDRGECAFIETYTLRALPRMLATLRQVGARPEDVRWVLVTHAHLDHAGGASALIAACPNATLLAHPRAARHLIDPSKLIAGAREVYGAERFAHHYGRIEPIAAERVRALDDGATLPLGGSTLRVHHTAGHANHHFVVHDPVLDTVFTGDAFGLVYPALQARGCFALASTSPVGFDANPARASLDLILGLGTRTAHPTHFGAVTALAEIGAQVRAWIDRAEAWVEAARGTDEPRLALAERWRQAIAAEAEARDLRFDEAAWDWLALDIDLNAQGLAYVAGRRSRR